MFDDTVTFVKTSEETGGEYTLLEIQLSPGGGNPLHYHFDYEETFTAKKGTLTVKKAKSQSLTLNPEESYTVKRNEVHGFANTTQEPITFEVKLSPGQPGFEDSLRIIYGLAHDGLMNKNGAPKDLATAFILGEMGKMKITDVMYKLIAPLGNWLAKKAIQKGKKEELINRYCR
jgi:quercetin dioxygenase-like cupin family protein